MNPSLVCDVMTTGAETIEPTATLQFAAARMKALRVGFLTVHDEPAGVLGVITDRDMVVRALAEGAPPDTTLVRDVMSAHVIWCYEIAELSQAVELMQQHGVRRLVVLDQDHRLSGVLSVDDVARLERGATAEVLRHSAI
jgi:CBS domain-containing protein